FYGKVTGDIVETDTLKFVSKEAFEQLPFSKSHRTIYENCVEKITMQ
ncbi:A/G-specific adenine glycosylase, partial [Klebsiella pneumoniae]|nr:A/G-specific adenine glycosylase [Klebsiella pneumoniae]